MFPVQEIQKAMAAQHVDGWLLYDFHGLDPLARRVLEIDPKAHLTRRWFYLIPQKGEPQKLSHQIEPRSLDHLPGDRHLYAGWRDLEKGLREITAGLGKVAMNYSPENAIPYVSRVDAGTVELVRSVGLETVSSADLIQQFEAVWSEEQLQSHIRAAKTLRALVDETFGFIAQNVGGGKLTEYDVQQFVMRRFDEEGLVTDSDIVASIGPNSGDPHYAPSREKHRPVRQGDFFLMDIWAKEKKEGSVFADITWTGFVGKEIPEKYVSIFEIVRDARDAGLRFVQEGVRAGRKVLGAEVDDVVRGHIASKGYGEYFIHRTGHNIGQEVHGNGAHIDNFETRDERSLIPGTCFSIEPGIYLKEFGVRSEIDVYISEKDAVVYGQPIQTDIIPILT